MPGAWRSGRGVRPHLADVVQAAPLHRVDVAAVLRVVGAQVGLALGAIWIIRPLPKGQRLRAQQQLVGADCECGHVVQGMVDAVRDLLPEQGAFLSV
eukprot:COSAG01_NODE_39927_length_470_cov_0.816712_1_plen_96_part_01